MNRNSQDNSVTLDLFDLTSETDVIVTLGVYSSDDSYTLPVPLDNGHTYEWDVMTYGINSGRDFTVELPGGGSQTLAAPDADGAERDHQHDNPHIPVVGRARSSRLRVLPQVRRRSVGPEPDADNRHKIYPVLWPRHPTPVPLRLGASVAYDGSEQLQRLHSAFSDFYPDIPASDSLPGAPTNLSPSGTVNTDRPTLSWSVISGVSYYNIQMFDETAGTGNRVLHPGLSRDLHSQLYLSGR